MNTNESRSTLSGVQADDLQRVALEAQSAGRFDHQLTMGDTTNASLRTEPRPTILTRESCDQRSRDRELPAETKKRPTSTRTDNPKDSFFHDRKSSGLREELLRSGRLIRHLRALLDVERRSHQAAMARARKFEEEQRERFFVFHARELERERDYHTTMMAIRNSEADQLRELIFSSMTAMGGVPEARWVETTRATVWENALFPLEQTPASSERWLPVQPLTCVRVVGESRIPHGQDVLSLISSFLVSMRIPIDVTVSRGAYHISAWLFANGKKPSERTAHAAVNTGSLPMVQLVFQHLQTPLSCGVFTELPIGSHSAIAEWLMREYPTHMANEFTRISSSLGQRPQTQWTRYIERLQRQWQWEDAIDEECWQRKRARLRCE